jgi:hypothetical protein
MTVTLFYLNGTSVVRTKWADDITAMHLRVLAVDPEFLQEMKLKKVEVSEKVVPEYDCSKGPKHGKIKK